MQITRAADYGMRGMMYLAALPDGKDAYVAQIARKCDIPPSFLAKIFQTLSKAGLVRSQRGARGGFILARPPEKITLLNIIEGIEGPLCLNLCLIDGNGCPRHNNCPAHKVFKEAQSRLIEVLDKYSLKDLVRKMRN